MRTDDYSLIAPFGETTVVFSYGDLDATQLVGTELYSETITSPTIRPCAWRPMWTRTTSWTT